MDEKNVPPVVGAIAPDFALPIAGKGQVFRLSEAVGRRPVVLIFYRGFW